MKTVILIGRDRGYGTETYEEGEKMEIRITRSRSGLPVMGVGGGAMSNTVTGRYVIREGKLLPALFVRSHGDLSNRENQAGVVIAVGDIVCVASGPRDTWGIDAYRVMLIWPECIEVEQLLLKNGVPEGTEGIDLFPPSVVEGLSLYHNRDGRYFVA